MAKRDAPTTSDDPLAPYRSIRKGDYLTLSGQSAHLLNRIHDEHGIPFRGRHLDLGAILPQLHALARDGLRARRSKAQPAPDENGHAEAMAEFRRERAITARLERMERERSLLPRDEVRGGLELLASTLRAAFAQLERDHGSEALAIMEDAMNTYDREVSKWFGANGSS